MLLLVLPLNFSKFKGFYSLSRFHFSNSLKSIGGYQYTGAPDLLIS